MTLKSLEYITFCFAFGQIDFNIKRDFESFEW